MRHLLAIVVGLPVTLLVGLILIGPDNLGFTLLLVVVCTAGFGLIPLFLLFWGVGLLVLSFFPKTQPAPPDRLTVLGQSPGPAKGQVGIRTLVYYMEKAKRGGKSEEEINFCMARAGWMPEEIEEARRLCMVSQPGTS